MKLKNENANKQNLILGMNESNDRIIEKLVDFIGKYMFSDDYI